MPTPLLLLQDIALNFGTTPLLTGAGLAVGAGDRVCLVGRNGSGKSTLLRIAAGLVQPDAGRVFVQPGATVRYLPQEPDLAGFPNTLAYVEAGLGTDAPEDRHRAGYLLEQLGLTGAESPPPCPAARPDAPRSPAPWPRPPTSCCWTSRPTTSTCPASNGWSASWPACAPAWC